MRVVGPVPAVFENPDGSRCFQAVLRSVLSHAFPERSYTWEDLDLLTGRRSGCWTWPTTALLRLQGMGLEVVTLEDFDYGAFADRGEDYLVEHLGREVARGQAARSDLAYEREVARRFLEQGTPAGRAPDFTDLEAFLRGGYLVVCNINRAVLKGKRGYSGHFVLVYALDGSTVWLHDPGPPASPELAVPRERFLEAWAFPDERARNLMAFKPGGAGGEASPTPRPGG